MTPNSTKIFKYRLWAVTNFCVGRVNGAGRTVSDGSILAAGDSLALFWKNGFDLVAFYHGFHEVWRVIGFTYCQNTVCARFDQFLYRLINMLAAPKRTNRLQ